MTAVPLVRVRDLAVFLKGKKPSVTLEVPSDGAFPYVLIEGFGGAYRTFTNDPGCVRCYRDDTIIVADGANTGLVSTNHDGYLGSTLGAVRPDRSKVNPRYLFYFIRGNFNTLNTKTRGAAVPHLERDMLLDFELALPSLPEQEQIVRILDEADALCIIRTKADTAIGNLHRHLFAEFFGDPIQNPRGWPTATVGDQLEFIEYGPRFYNEVYSLTGTKIVRITDLDTDGNLNFAGMPMLDVDAKTLTVRGLKPGDLIFARSGATVGKVALIPQEVPPCIAGAYFIRMHFKDEVNPTFAFEYFRSAPIQEIILRQSKQAAQQNFSGPLIRALSMPVPPAEVQREFVARVAEIRELEGSQVASRRRFDDLFQSLLHRAFQGEL